MLHHRFHFVYLANGTPNYLMQIPSLSLLQKVRTRLQADEVPIPIQTAAAVVIAYIVASFLTDRENLSWAAFSALFVVQASIGGTISAALGRIAGAALGAVIAVAFVVLLGDLAFGTLITLVLGVGLMSFLAAKWPILAYGLVTVTIIAVAPDFYLVEGAFKKVWAIAIGSVCGMVAAFTILPVHARRTEQEYLGAALRYCGSYVLDCTACLVRDKSNKNRKAPDAIQRSIERARLMAREARIEERTPTMGFSPYSHTLLLEIERFAYTLTLVDRFSDKPFSEMLCHDTKEALLELANVVKLRLDKIADSIEAGQVSGEIDDAQGAYKKFAQRIDDSVLDDRHSIDDKEHIVSIKSAYCMVLSNLADLAHHARGREAQA